MGSPRRGGNTEHLLNCVLEGAKSRGAEVDKLVVCDYSISPCLECLSCSKEGKCKVDDDMQEVYPKLLKADVVVIASPVFFKGVPAQLKALIDRCQCLWARKYLLKQPLGGKEKRNSKGAFVSVGGLRTLTTFDGAILTVKSLFHVLGISYEEQLLFPAVDEKGQIQQVQGAMDKAFKLGETLVSEGDNEEVRA